MQCGEPSDLPSLPQEGRNAMQHNLQNEEPNAKTVSVSLPHNGTAEQHGEEQAGTHTAATQTVDQKADVAAMMEKTLPTFRMKE